MINMVRQSNTAQSNMCITLDRSSGQRTDNLQYLNELNMPLYQQIAGFAMRLQVRFKFLGRNEDKAAKMITQFPDCNSVGQS